MTEADHPIDRWRHGLIAFLLDYWDRIHPQLNSRCPARNLRNPNPELQDDRPCFKCVDQKVMTCVVHNIHNEKRMRLYLPKRTKE